MAFGCEYYYSFVYNQQDYSYNGCTAYNGAYNADYGRCCSYGWTEFGAWMMWIVICMFFVAIMVMAARARQRRRMMYMEQMQMN